MSSKPLPDMSHMFDRWDRRRRPKLNPRKCKHPTAALSVHGLALLRVGKTVHCPGCNGALRLR